MEVRRNMREEGETWDETKERGCSSEGSKAEEGVVQVSRLENDCHSRSDSHFVSFRGFMRVRFVKFHLFCIRRAR